MKSYPPVAASNNAHSHLSRSPQNGQTQTHFSIGFLHCTQIANSSLCFNYIWLPGLIIKSCC